MIKQLTMLAALALLASGCGEATTDQASNPTAVETPETNTASAPSDSTAAAAEIDNATTEIENASAEVDSLLSEI